MLAALLALCAAPQAAPAPVPDDPAPQVVTDWLVIAPTDRSGRRPFSPSAVFAAHLLVPDAPAPKAGDVLKGELGKELAWEPKKAGEDGSLGGGIGWAYAAVESKSARVVLAKLSGASRLFVNGTGYVGDVYAYGFGGVPVALREGPNDVYVGGVRGSFRLELVDVEGPLVHARWDDTIPDMAPPQADPMFRSSDSLQSPVVPCGVLAWNATSSALALSWSPGPELDRQGRARLAPFAPSRLGLRVRGLTIDAGAPLPETVHVPLEVRLGSEPISWAFDIALRSPGEARRVGYVSEIDGSAQWCAYVPAQNPDVPARTVLSLHGASVDAMNQARSYAPKSEFEFVCPTNRRPFGFDWQDWGRRDAYEALQALGRTDPRSQVYLTGHSMGGHGTWSLAANDPDRFLAIAPSAGWCSFDSYGGRPDGELKEIWQRADGTSRTLDLVSNLAPIPTYVLHGTADDNVPASEAHDMIAALEKAGGQPQSHFQEGAGHWWDGDRAPGADCVDWPEIFALFQQAKLGGRAREFDWVSADPGVDSRNFWVEVLQPLRYGQPFRVTSKLGAERGARGFALETDNVRRLRVHAPPSSLTVTVDGKVVRGSRPVELALTATGWNPAPPAGAAEKSPERSGPFKRAFDRRFVLVYGTKGDDAEDRELFERARYDLCTWWYRANGTPDLLSDVEALAAPLKGRNVLLYGNSDTNAAWGRFLGLACPLVAERGALKLGERAWQGDDLAAVLVFPRADDDDALVGAFADTGVRGSRVGYTLAPFVSGVGYPDYAVFSSRVLKDGDGGVLAAGWFDHRWQLDPRAFVRPEPK